MNFIDFQDDAVKYERCLSSVRTEYQLPDKWFAYPDHLAVKCKDTESYLSTIELIKPQLDLETLGEIDQAGRRLASGSFSDPMRLGDYLFEMIEIMEPKPNSSLIEYTFVEHAEFTVNDLLTVISDLNGKVSASDKTVKVVDGRASHHPGILLEFSDGLEVKFNEMNLARMVADEKRRKIWRKIK